LKLGQAKSVCPEQNTPNAIKIESAINMRCTLPSAFERAVTALESFGKA
jgi:hypothetical protein